MNRKIGLLAAGLALLSLAGCGLKGPLYVQPVDNNTSQTTPEQSQQQRQKAQQQAEAQQSMEQGAPPNRNDRNTIN